MAKKGDYERTCRRCENRWFIPKALADEKAPSGLQMAAARLRSTGANTSAVSFSRGRKAAKVARLEDQRAAVLERDRCPECGASDFDQRDA